MSDIIVPNISESEAENLDRVLRYALTKDEKRRFDFEHRQRQIARAAEMFAPDKYSVLGEPMLELDPEVFFAWETLHKGCWDDKTFIREFARDNDACRAKKPQRRIFNGF